MRRSEAVAIAMLAAALMGGCKSSPTPTPTPTPIPQNTPSENVPAPVGSAGTGDPGTTNPPPCERDCEGHVYMKRLPHDSAPVSAWTEVKLQPGEVASLQKSLAAQPAGSAGDSAFHVHADTVAGQTQFHADSDPSHVSSEAPAYEIALGSKSSAPAKLVASAETLRALQAKSMPANGR